MSSSCDDLILTTGSTPVVILMAKANLAGMAKFPGSTVDEYSKLVGLNESHLYPIIIAGPCKPVILPNLPINGNGFVILKTDGSSLERISNSELIEKGFELSPALAAAIDASWTCFNDQKHKAIDSNLEFVPPLSLNWIGADGSIAVSSATGVNWTVVGGRDQLQSNFERFKELPPEIACQMSILDILHITSGVAWTLSDAIQLLNSFSGGSLPPPSTYWTIGGIVPSLANNAEDPSLSIGPLGIDKLKENNVHNFFFRLLSDSLGKVGKILLTAGKNIDSQVGAAIISVVGVASQPVSQPNDNGMHITPFECVRLVCYASSCLLMFTSWMLKPTSRGTPVKEKRLNTLSHLTAGGAVICAFVGILCNIFAPLPLSYAACAISICVFFVLGAASYNAFSN